MTSADSAPQTGPLFPELTGSLRRLPRDEVARHQRTRLEAALREAVLQNGYAATTLRELVTLAGVSKSTFYDHFENKQQCFLATSDHIFTQVSERVAAAYRQPGDFRERLVNALRCFMELVVAEPAAAWLTAVESLTLGRAGVDHREAGSAAFELMFRQSFDHSPSPVHVSDMTVRAIVGGIRGVVYRRLRAHRAEELPGMVDELVDWALRYQSEPNEQVQLAIEAAGREGGGPADRPGGEEEISWEEPPDSSLSRRSLTQRQRIVRGAARYVVEQGYDTLSIPAISGAAGVSNQTFYENFSSKADAFLSAFAELAEEGLRLSAAAYYREGDNPAAVGAGLRTLLDYTATHRLFARLSFFELPTAGPVALDYADTMMDRFGAFLQPEIVPSALAQPVSDATLEAISTGIWSAIQHEITHGRLEQLPEIAPAITWIALAPLND
jgi:AcrR family transcriptional regulator